MKWPWSRPDAPAAKTARARRQLLKREGRKSDRMQAIREKLESRMVANVPRSSTGDAAQDAAVDGAFVKAAGLTQSVISEALFEWFGNQGFIGHQMAALLSQHWLIDKACAVPARDAVRNGWRTQLDGTKDDKNEEQKLIDKINKRMRVKQHALEFMRKGRVFGVRIALFKVETSNPDAYYNAPFNIDGVTKGTYKGIVQVDPYWCAPVMSEESMNNPASPGFYEPEWWTIRGRTYHKSHLVIFRTCELPDILKPQYLYGGIPLPQQIMERVYGAERTANEVPQLVLSKRLTAWNTALEDVLANQDDFMEHMGIFSDMRDNFGVKIMDIEDKMMQFDTALNGLDDVMMANYNVVAAVARMPATKLMSTSPQGMNATGEYDEAAYHEDLESSQENDLSPLVDRHTQLLLRSEIEPNFGYAPGALEATIEWNPLDAPTAKEQAEVGLIEAQRDVQLVTAGAIDGEDVRNRVRTQRDSGYVGISSTVPEPEPEEAPADGEKA